MRRIIYEDTPETLKPGTPVVQAVETAGGEFHVNVGHAQYTPEQALHAAESTIKAAKAAIAARVEQERSNRTRTMDGMTSQSILAAFRESMEYADAGYPTRYISGDNLVAVLVPAKDFHPTDECCCSNCPWNGNHSDRPSGQNESATG